jgi:hypothetical protein
LHHSRIGVVKGAKEGFQRRWSQIPKCHHSRATQRSRT